MYADIERSTYMDIFGYHWCCHFFERNQGEQVSEAIYKGKSSLKCVEVDVPSAVEENVMIQVFLCITY